MMYEYADEWGDHRHEICGPPYDPKKPITCPACIAMLDSSLSGWLDTLTERHNLPAGFWDHHKFPWSVQHVDSP